MDRSDFQVDLIPQGWRMGGVLRSTQARRGDMLVALGGGAGVEHLAELYVGDGKPVLPVRSGLNAISTDGNGGANSLHARALDHPETFIRFPDFAPSAAGRLSQLALRPEDDPRALAEATCRLVADLRPPQAFCVRLLDPSHRSFPAVERFFRSVAHPAIGAAGYTPFEIGGGIPRSSFMNVEIFTQLHRAALTVADLTGGRPNCYMELGYVLGRGRPFVVCAQEGTQLSFDADKIPTYFWSESRDTGLEQTLFRQWIDRYAVLPSLVSADK